MIRQVIWTSTIDWPGELSTVIFFDQCNFRCSYCHNMDLNKQPEISFESVLEKLIERKPILDHVILSGGEPTLSDNYYTVIKKLRDNGFKVGIHTNGSKHFKITEAILQYGVSFIGVDIKTYSNRKYLDDFVKDGDETFMYSNVLNLITILKTYYPEVKTDIRTTLNKDITIDDLISIAEDLHKIGIEKYYLQYEVKDGKQIKYFTKEQYDDVKIIMDEYVKVEFR